MTYPRQGLPVAVIDILDSIRGVTHTDQQELTGVLPPNNGKHRGHNTKVWIPFFTSLPQIPFPAMNGHPFDLIDSEGADPRLNELFPVMDATHAISQFVQESSITIHHTEYIPSSTVHSGQYKKTAKRPAPDSPALDQEDQPFKKPRIMHPDATTSASYVAVGKSKTDHQDNPSLQLDAGSPAPMTSANDAEQPGLSQRLHTLLEEAYQVASGLQGQQGLEPSHAALLIRINTMFVCSKYPM